MIIQTSDKGYHIRGFDKRARRLAKAGASLAGIDIGPWIARAVYEKFARDFAGHTTVQKEDDQCPTPSNPESCR